MVTERRNRMLLTRITESCSFRGMDWKAHIKSLVAAGASIEEVAIRMGVTGNAVREILAGRTKAPRADAAFRLANLRPADFSAKPQEAKDAA